MIVLVAKEGELRSAIETELARAGHEVVLWSADEDLFDASFGAEAIVYVPFGSTLEAGTAPRADAERARRVLGAAKAPGVEMTVFVLPEIGYDEEERVLRCDGKPYVVVRTQLVLEDVADVLKKDGWRSLWLPREGQVRAVRAEAVGRGVVEALTTEEQGSDLPVESAELSAPELFERAAALAGDVRVHAVRSRTFRMVRPIARWLKRGEPAALALWDGLAPSP